MLVALGDKPARRTRTVVTMPAGAEAPAVQALSQYPTQNATPHVTPVAPTNARAQAVHHKPVQSSASIQPDPAPTVQSTQTEATRADADLASELIESGVTTQPVETVLAVLAARRGGASIIAAAKASGINFRTARRIVEPRASAAPALGGQLTGCHASAKPMARRRAA
jgi:hypothetical protein